MCVFLCLCDYYILHTLEDGWRVAVRDAQLREQETQTESVMDGAAYRRDPRGAEGSEDVRMSLKGWAGTLYEGTYRGGYGPCGPDRCYGRSHRLSERQRQCEKLMCPTYSS